jgi:hypothetical protein
MAIYSVQLEVEQPRNTWGQKTLIALLFAGLFFLFRFGWSLLAPTALEKERGLLSVALEVGLFSLVWGSLMAFIPRRWFSLTSRLGRNSRPEVYLFVDEESISSEIRPAGTRTTVRRGKIRSIFQIKGRLDGMGISERSEFGARMLGFVYLPASLPEYEELKRLAESWRATK